MPTEVGRQFDAIFGSTQSQQKKSAPINVEAKFCQATKAITLIDRNGKNADVVLRGIQAENFKTSFLQMKKDCPHISVPNAIAALSAPYISHWLEI